MNSSPIEDTWCYVLIVTIVHVDVYYWSGYLIDEQEKKCSGVCGRRLCHGLICYLDASFQTAVDYRHPL